MKKINVITLASLFVLSSVGYAQAAREMHAWIKREVMVKEPQPSVYVYEQQYRDLTGKAAGRIGFLSLIKTDPRRIKKHESTLDGPKRDRFSLMKSVRAQLSPVFALFRDRTGAAQAVLQKALRKNPVVDVKISGVRHRMFVEHSPKNLKALKRIMSTKPVYIADGHHRFEVTRRFQERERKADGRKGRSSTSVLTFLCDAQRNDLTIYPTHRVLRNLSPGWPRAFEKTLKQFFRQENFTSLGALLLAIQKESPGKPSFGYFCDGIYGRLIPKRSTSQPNVSVLDRYFIRKLLPEGVAKSERISFTRDVREAAGWVRSGKADIAFFLPKMPIQEMIRVSDEGIMLPQKSTYFYPKLLSGIVFHKF